MKKFLVLLIALIVTISVTGIVIYLVRDDEYISANTTLEYVNKGEEVALNYSIINRKKSSKVEIVSSDNSILSIDNGLVKAVSGGKVTVSIGLTNARGKKETLTKEIYVGDGSVANPFYIRNAQDLNNLCKDGHVFTATSNYLQTADITLYGNYQTRNVTFNGVYNGHGFKIVNYASSGEASTSAMFDKIGANGYFGYVNFEKVNINGAYDIASVVAGTNNGLIDYVTIAGTITNTKEGNTLTASIVGENVTDTSSSTNSSGNVAYVQRCVNKGSIYTAGKNAGGIVCSNSGVITSCQNGNNDITAKNAYGDINFTTEGVTDIYAGGIVAVNHSTDAALKEKVSVSNCYSIGGIYATNATGVNVGGVIGNNTSATDIFYIYGNYYLTGVENTLVTRGISNSEATEEGKDTVYVAHGVTDEVLVSNTLTSFVTSYEGTDDKNLTAWDKNVWMFTANNLPSLRPMSDSGFTFVRLTLITPPTASVAASNQIKSAEDFIALAKTGLLTGSANAGKEYTIMNDIDFASYNSTFVVVGTESNPVTVNLIARTDDNGSATIKNLEITNDTQAIKEDGTLGTVADVSYAGFFGVTSETTFTNLTFENYNLIASSANIGGIAGKMINTVVNGGAIKSSIGAGNSYSSSIGVNQTTAQAGGVTAIAEGTTISNFTFTGTIETTHAVTSSHHVIGGLVATLGVSDIDFSNLDDSALKLNDADSYVDNSKFEGRIVTQTTQDTVIGGLVGVLQGGSCVARSDVNATMTGYIASGLVATNSGVIQQCESVSTVNAIYGAGVSYTFETSNARVFNCYVETTFTCTDRTANCGLIGNMAANSKAFNCVNVNNFNNNGTSANNFAKTLKAVQFTFKNTSSGASFDDLYDVSLNIDASFTTSTTPLLTNCFYVNKVNGVESNDEASTKFHQQTSATSHPFGHLGCDGVADGTHHTIAWVVSGDRINGDLGTGRINTSGKLYTAPEAMTFAKLGFDSGIWSNTSSGFSANGMLRLA